MTSGPQELTSTSRPRFRSSKVSLQSCGTQKKKKNVLHSDKKSLDANVLLVTRGYLSCCYVGRNFEISCRHHRDWILTILSCTTRLQKVKKVQSRVPASKLKISAAGSGENGGGTNLVSPAICIVAIAVTFESSWRSIRQTHDRDWLRSTYVHQTRHKAVCWYQVHLEADAIGVPFINSLLHMYGLYCKLHMKANIRNLPDLGVSFMRGCDPAFLPGLLSEGWFTSDYDQNNATITCLMTLACGARKHRPEACT